MKPPRGLSREEAALWRKVTATVTPLDPALAAKAERDSGDGAGSPPEAAPAAVPVIAAASQRASPARTQAGQDKAGHVPPLSPDRGLDASWDRRLRAGALSPDFTLDLHGHTLEQAHRRLDMGLGQARAMGARVVLLIAGKPRPAEAADRGSRRGAIRAEVLDWLAAGPHASRIAAVRKAHRRHGGDGALYLVLKRGG
jgi:DNA-nicking Smr family endonuclease